MNFNGETFHFKLFYKNNTAKIPTTKQYKEKKMCIRDRN